ncbi:MAG: glycosyltransferase family 2 protein [Gracilimonas sp.]
MTHYPKVTVGIPVLNEESHIEKVVNGFLKAGYPNLVEVLIADGGSTDNTRKIVNTLSEKDKRVKLVHNPDKFQSFALNKMIDQAEGDIFLRADGHCMYQDDYIEKSVEILLKTKARNAGGAQRYVAETPIQAGIAIAVKSFLGNGGAKYMDEKYEGYADTVFLGCFWTADLREIEGFSTKNRTNQDSELNLRLAEVFGKSIYVSPEIKSWYYPRECYVRLFTQYFRYGRGRFLTKLLHPNSSPIRGLIPFLFICFLIVYGTADIISGSNYYFPEFVALLMLIVLIESLRVVIKTNVRFKKEIWKSESEPPGIFSKWIHVMVSVVIMQIGHFSGFLYQLVKKITVRNENW